MNRKLIAIIEDEKDIAEVIQYNLSREGLDVACATDGEAGLAMVRERRPALVILDLMLPGLDGIEVCRRLKADEGTATIPIVMVTAKGEESDIVLGLGLGADDYITKPFSPKELVARVKAVLRRSRRQREEDGGEVVVRDGVTIDSSRHEVTVDGEAVRFTATEFRLLRFLASRPGRVYTRDELISRVLGHDAMVVDRTIDVHVRAIRAKLGPHRHLLETIRGVGYRFRDLE